MTGSIIYALTLVITQNWALEKPYSISLEPTDGYQDNAGAEAFTDFGVFYHGELTNGDPGSCMLEFTGWRGNPESEIIVEVVIDLEKTVQVGLIRGMFYSATPDLSIFRAYVSENLDSFTALHHSFYRQDLSETIYMLSTGDVKPKQGRYVKVVMGMHHPGYLRCGELEIYANPLDTEYSTWQNVKLGDF